MQRDLTMQQDLPVQRDLIVQQDLPMRRDLTVQQDLPVQRDLTVQQDLPVQRDLPVQQNLPVQRDLSDVDMSLQQVAGTSDVSMREKLARDPCLGEEQAMEEELARSRQRDMEEDMLMLVRGASSDPRWVSTMTTTGPPWHDEYTGEELPHDLVSGGMNRELASHESFHVQTWVPESDADGHEVIDSRWLLKRKGDRVKARLVAQQFNTGAPQDT